MDRCRESLSPDPVPHPLRCSESVQTLFVLLSNNGNRRRFKYRPLTVHRGVSLISIQQHLLKRFAHDLNVDKLMDSPSEMQRVSSFEINDRRHRDEMVLFEHIHDLFDGAKIRIKLKASFFEKQRLRECAAHSPLAAAPNLKRIRRRSKSASLRFEAESECKFEYHSNDDVDVIDGVEAKRDRVRASGRSSGSLVVDGVEVESASMTATDSKVSASSMEWLVVDNGSWSIKCGFGGHLGP